LGAIDAIVLERRCLSDKLEQKQSTDKWPPEENQQLNKGCPSRASLDQLIDENRRDFWQCNASAEPIVLDALVQTDIRSRRSMQASCVHKEHSKRF
jgi:hypothetical protein